MVQFRDFTPSDDVLDAIRSLRADDDGLAPLERDAETATPPTMLDSRRRAENAVIAKYDHLTTGRYLRARV